MRTIVATVAGIIIGVAGMALVADNTHTTMTPVNRDACANVTWDTGDGHPFDANRDGMINCGSDIELGA